MAYYDDVDHKLARDFDHMNVRAGDQPYGSAKPDYYDRPSPTQAYSRDPSSPPVYSPPSDKPTIPSGWIPQFDQQYQRWYYFEEQTGQSQWEAPGYIPPRPPMPGADRGHDSSYSGYHGEGAGHDGYGGGGGYQYGEEPKKSSGAGKTIMAGAGGAVLGLAGGAMLANAFNDGDSDGERHYAQPDAQQYSGGAPLQQEIDSSDAESLQEAREDYNEAREAAQDSDASSSDQEELEEAQEEYEEEYEEAYDDE